MKQNYTELVFLLDRSGSMSGLEADTIGGFNAMIEKQKQETGEASVTTVLFDSRVEMLHDRVALQEIAPMTNRDYYVRGMTALLDAVGSTIRHISHQHAAMDEDQRPVHTMFVITTDGMENASREYNIQTVRNLIAEKKTADNWEFLFLGANIDAVQAAGQIGIGADRAVKYRSDHVGTSLNYEVVNNVVSSMRCGAGVLPDWKQRIDADCRNRKG